MNLVVWAPLLLPLLAVPAARRLAELLPPRYAAWLLAVSAVALAGCTLAALGLLAGAGAIRLPPVAALGHVSLPLLGDGSDVTAPAACVATALLAGSAAALIATARRHLAPYRSRRSPAPAALGGDLAVVQEPAPDAYALPGRPGRIVVTTGMLRALGPDEREALFAHERAHLAGRHHLFLAAVALAAACHPALRALRGPLGYALERWADESAATRIGDRRLTARAIGRAALAAHAASRSTGRPPTALAVDAGPVPRRVAALLGPEPSTAPLRSRAPRLVAAALLGCLALSAVSAAVAAYELHGSIETAQGQR